MNGYYIEMDYTNFIIIIIIWSPDKIKRKNSEEPSERFINYDEIVV